MRQTISTFVQKMYPQLEEVVFLFKETRIVKKSSKISRIKYAF